MLTILLGAALAQEGESPPVEVTPVPIPAELPPAELPADSRGKRYAVVIGLSTYAHLPPELHLASGHGDASRVALALREEAGYADVRLITDAEATRARIETVLRDELGPVVTAEDSMLLYFVGRGLGGDFDEPYLLVHETDPEDLQATAWPVADIAASLPQWVQAGGYALVTDAAHDARLGDLALVGPSAGSWPDMGAAMATISATSRGEVGREGLFAKHFIDAITGGGDADKDGVVTVAELNRYLVIAVPHENQAQHPSSAGRSDSTMPVSGGVTYKDILPELTSAVETQVLVVREQVEAATEVIVIREQFDGAELPTHTVDKAKFVMKGISDPQVTCREQEEPTQCDPNCYLREVLAGPCTVVGFSDSIKLEGSVFVAARGVYECQPGEEDEIDCTSPTWKGD